jgi:hypothetical protein
MEEIANGREIILLAVIFKNYSPNPTGQYSVPNRK